MWFIQLFFIAALPSSLMVFVIYIAKRRVKIKRKTVLSICGVMIISTTFLICFYMPRAAIVPENVTFSVMYDGMMRNINEEDGK